MKDMITGEEVDLPKTRVCPPPRVDEEKVMSENLKKVVGISQEQFDLHSRDIAENRKSGRCNMLISILSLLLAFASLVVAIIAL